MPNSSVWLAASAYSFCQLNWRLRVLKVPLGRPLRKVSLLSALCDSLKCVVQSAPTLPLTKADSVYSSLLVRLSSVGRPKALSNDSLLFE
ncbi:hypothetical protein D3C72_1338550 [compost metagenome]